MGRVFLRRNLCAGQDEGQGLEQREVFIGSGQPAPTQECLGLLDAQASSMQMSMAEAELSLPVRDVL